MSHRILISGHINIETTLAIDAFPLDYYPVNYPFFGIQSSVSGTGYNIAKALTTLNDKVTMVSLVGNDGEANRIEAALKAFNVHEISLSRLLRESCQSVIIFDEQGRRQIHTDLKNLQDISLPADQVAPHFDTHDLIVMGNHNFNRQHLPAARASGKLIATDVHVLSDVNDEYNRDFIESSHIVFMSDEGCKGKQRVFLKELAGSCSAAIIVMGMGSEGALMYLRQNDTIERCPAYFTRDVVSTVGAGDALFSAFLHSYLEHFNAYRAIQTACIFASYKIGARSASDGLLTKDGLEQLLASKEYRELTA